MLKILKICVSLRVWGMGFWDFEGLKINNFKFSIIFGSLISQRKVLALNIFLAALSCVVFPLTKPSRGL